MAVLGQIMALIARSEFQLPVMTTVYTTDHICRFTLYYASNKTYIYPVYRIDGMTVRGLTIAFCCPR